jgi:PAS domain S-box-containing protein
VNRFLLPLNSLRLARVAVGVGLAILALILRLGLDRFLGHVAPWAIFFLAVVLASVVGGFAAGGSAAVSAVGLGGYFLFRPRLGFWPPDPEDSAGIVVFLATSLTISVVGHGLRRALERRDSALSTLDALIDNSPVGISLFDRERRFVRLNKVVAETTGIAPTDHIGRTISELLPDAPGHTERKLARVLETGETIVDEEVVADAPTAPGDQRVWQVSVFPASRSDGRVTAVGLLSRDITDRTREERQRGETLRFAEQFIGILAHDLRNPVAAIRMAATTLKRRAADDEETKSVDRILGSSKRIDRMIGQLLELTRARLGGGIVLDRTVGNLSQAVLAVVDELRMATPGRRIECDVQPDVVGTWDIDRVAQVVSNLVGNAVTHGDSDGTVHVRLREEGIVTLDVRNFGPPIPESEQEHIFDPYRQREGNRHQGLGLGLFIVKQIVLAHGGQISVRSTAEDGTTFSVSLPGAAAGHPAAPPAAPSLL